MDLSKIYAFLAAKSKPIPPVPAAVWQDPVYFFAFGFGSGAFPFAPGTCGTLAAIPFYLALNSLPLTYYLLIISLVIIGGILACEKISRATHTHDHPGMCIDEFGGFFVAMAGAPHGIGWVILGFSLFRFFDIIKPWPINLIDERVNGGLGMMLDDIAAGLYSAAILQIISLLLQY